MNIQKNLTFKLKSNIYNNIIYNYIHVNNNFGFTMFFECEIIDFNINDIILMKIDYNKYFNYIKLINKIEKDINQNILLLNSLFFDESNNIYLLGNLIKDNDSNINNLIFTSFYRTYRKKMEYVNINKEQYILSNNFKAIVTLRLSYLNNVNILHNDIIRIIIKKE